MIRKILVGISALALTACSQIDDNEIGLKRVFGELEDVPVKGLVWYNPWSTDIISFDNKQKKLESEVTIPTFDQQRAQIKSTVTVQLTASSAARMYRDVGQDWVTAIVPQLVKSAQLDILGNYTATDVIQKQDEVSGKIRNRLIEQLSKRGVLVTDYQLTEVTFSKSYMEAVEAKATAVQQAEAAKNETAKIKEQGIQTEIKARSEAESMRVRAQALSSNPKLIEYERLRVEEAAIAAWKAGGSKVPTTVMGGTGAGIPFVNVPLK